MIVMNHQDESCLFTTKKDGTYLPFNAVPKYTKRYRREQIDIRVEELLGIADIVRKDTNLA